LLLVIITYSPTGTPKRTPVEAFLTIVGQSHLNDGFYVNIIRRATHNPPRGFPPPKKKGGGGETPPPGRNEL